MIDGKKLFEQMLKLPAPWQVVEVQIDEDHLRIEVHIDYLGLEGVCPQTGEVCKIYDRKERRWRHLDTMEYETWICARLPRIKNSLGQYHQIPVDWAEPGMSHTMKFETHCMKVFQKTHCQQSAAVLMRISNDKVCGMMHRSVQRGLNRRDLTRHPVEALSIDEKSYSKGPKFMTILSDAANGRVLDIIRHRSEDAATALIHKVFNKEQLAAVKKTCCDLAPPYISALKKTVPTPGWFTISSMSSGC